MKIKLSSIYASPHMTAQPGSIIDVSDEEGAQLVDGRYGVELANTAAVQPSSPPAPAGDAENASTSAPETAGRRASRGSRGRSTAAAPAAPEASE